MPASPILSRVTGMVSLSYMHDVKMRVGTMAARQHPIPNLTRASLFLASRERPLCWPWALCP